MIKILGKSWQRIIAVMLTVVFLGTPGLIGFTAANASGLVSENVVLAAQNFQQQCPTCKNIANSKAVEFAKTKMGLSVEVLSGSNVQHYLGLFKSFNGFNNLGNSLLVYKVVRVKPLNYVYISGTFKAPMNDTLIYAVINGNTDDIAVLKTVKYNDKDNMLITDYLNKGATTNLSLETIIQANEKRTQDMDEFMNRYNSEGAITPQSFEGWQKWVCSFAGLVACGTGCAVFIAVPGLPEVCWAACCYFWDNGLC